LRILGKSLLFLVTLAIAGLGLAWLTADHWTGELARPSIADSRLQDVDWPAYGNDQGGSRYSVASQVNRNNLESLAPVWTFRTGETGEGYRSGYKHSFQATPVLAGNTLYFSTAFNRVFAIDAENGQERWRFDAELDPDEGFSEVSNRGVAYWLDSTAQQDEPCRERILIGTLDARLIALDAATGERCAGFANNGEIDLKTALREEDRGRAYPVTSPPAPGASQRHCRHPDLVESHAISSAVRHCARRRPRPYRDRGRCSIRLSCLSRAPPGH